jgi:putative lipoic acid-binding regulatory protein
MWPLTMTSKNESAFSFPCDFPIKAMGHASGNFEITILEIVRRHAPDLTEESFKSRPSSNGKYLSVTVTIRAESRKQLDAIYMDLTACEHVLMAL